MSTSRLRLGRLLFVGNALDQALDLASAAAELDSRNAGIFALKAAILLKLNDNSSAEREAQAALEIDPANAGAMIVLAADR